MAKFNIFICFKIIKHQSLNIVSSHRQIRFEYNAKLWVQRNRISLKPVGKSSQADSNFIFVNIPKTRGKLCLVLE